MRNIIAASALAVFTSACSVAQSDYCVVSRDGNNHVRRAEIFSSDGTSLQYATGFTSTLQGVWQGAGYKTGEDDQPDTFFTVDESRQECAALSSRGTSAAPIVSAQ